MEYSYLKGGYFVGEFNKYQMGKGKYTGKPGYQMEVDRDEYGIFVGDITVTDPSGFSFKFDSARSTKENLDELRHLLNPQLLSCKEMGVCTKAYTKKNFFPQIIFKCKTCGL